MSESPNSIIKSPLSKTPIFSPSPKNKILIREKNAILKNVIFYHLLVH